LSQSKKRTVTRDWLNWVTSDRARRAIQGHLIRSHEFLAAMKAGKHRARHGDPGAAIENLQIATQLQPGSSWAWNRLGNAYRVAGRNEESLDAHRQARRAHPQNRSALTGLGNSQFLSKRFEEAAELFRESCTARDGNANALFGLARCLLAQGRYKIAADTFDACLRAATTRERKASASTFCAITRASLLADKQAGALTDVLDDLRRNELEHEIRVGLIEALRLFDTVPLLGPMSICHKALAVACTGNGDPVQFVARLSRLRFMNGIVSGLKIDIDSICESARKCLDGIQGANLNHERPSRSLIRLREWLDRSISKSLA
jgi:tetratricopeptide (TPR) repeat protein